MLKERNKNKDDVKSCNKFRENYKVDVSLITVLELSWNPAVPPPYLAQIFDLYMRLLLHKFRGFSAPFFKLFFLV